MKVLRTVFAVLLSLILILLTACGEGGSVDTPSGGENPEASGETVHLQLLYCSKDTLNPFKTKNKSNFELSGLLYESLVRLDSSFNPIYSLAEGSSFENNLCTVRLKSISFSDGSPLTSEDVLYSYSLARESEIYSHLFYEVVSVSATDTGTVAFTLSKSDPYFVNLLTFPIIKKDSDKLKNEDNVELAPIGAGKYVFSEKAASLIPNTNYYGEKATDDISLVDAPDSESVAHYVEIGATDFYYTDPLKDNIVRMSGKKSTLNMINLFYLGINHSYGALSNPLLRHTLSSAIDRNDIVEAAFYDYAKVANGFFHPDWSEISGYQTLQSESDTKICIENLEEIGYNRLDSEGMRLNDKGTPLAFTLLVPSQNKERLSAAELIKEQLAEVGIKITVNAVSDEQFTSALAAGQFQLYLGEVRLTANMDISSLVLPSGSAAYGLVGSTAADGEAAAADHTTVISQYYSGQSSISEVATSLISNMPIVPITYRSALLFYSHNISKLSDAERDSFFSLVRFTK